VGADDDGSTTSVATEACVGDGGGAAQGWTLRSKAARAMAAVEAGARDSGGTTRGRAKAEARR
jgi:hypothetical protein